MLYSWMGKKKAQKEGLRGSFTENTELESVDYAGSDSGPELQTMLI